jgi:hypothetical protein
LRLGLGALAGALLGWMSPLLRFPGDLFPGGLPTLEAQYVLKGPQSSAPQPPWSPPAPSAPATSATTDRAA